MMTIDEAITKYNELANNDRTCYPEEAQQLAQWLDELKAFRENKWTDIYIKRGYDKAIDDFASEIKNFITESTVMRYSDIDEIAEQLKAGVRDA